jgi:hypothetical protein
VTPAEALLPCPEGTQVGEVIMTKEAEALSITTSDQHGRIDIVFANSGIGKVTALGGHF